MLNTAHISSKPHLIKYQLNLPHQQHPHLLPHQPTKSKADYDRQLFLAMQRHNAKAYGPPAHKIKQMLLIVQLEYIT